MLLAVAAGLAGLSAASAEAAPQSALPQFREGVEFVLQLDPSAECTPDEDGEIRIRDDQGRTDYDPEDGCGVGNLNGSNAALWNGLGVIGGCNLNESFQGCSFVFRGTSVPGFEIVPGFDPIFPGCGWSHDAYEYSGGSDAGSGREVPGTNSPPSELAASHWAGDDPEGSSRIPYYRTLLECAYSYVDVGTDIASTCGRAKFAWYNVASHDRFMKKGRKACVFVVSNRVARELLRLAFAGPIGDGRTLTSEFFEIIKKQVGASTDPDSERTEKLFDELDGILEESPILKKVLPGFGEAVATAKKSDPLYRIAQVPLKNLEAMLGIAKLSFIVNKDACFAIRTKMLPDGKVHGKGSILLNAGTVRDRDDSVMGVLQRKQRRLRFDTFERRQLNLACGEDGMVTVGPRRQTGKVFKGARTERSGISRRP